MFPSFFINLKRRRHVQDLLAVLNRNHPSCGETAAITGALDAVDHRDFRIPRADEISMQRMAEPTFNRPVSCGKRLGDNMAAKNANTGFAA